MGYAVGLVSALSARYEVQARRRLRRGPLLTAETARLVQPGASQHPLSRARPDRVHRDADGRRLDRALDRPREGSRHDGAGEDVAGRSARLRHRQDDAVFRACRWSRRSASSALSMLLFDLPMRGSWVMLLLAISIFLVGRAGVRRADLDARRDAAGGVSARAADVVSADADAVGIHLPDLQHAGGAAGDHLRGAGALLSDRAARDRAQGRRPRRCSGGTSAALVVFAALVLSLASLRLKREWAVGQ